jgi:hypothetical protein
VMMPGSMSTAAEPPAARKPAGSTPGSRPIHAAGRTVPRGSERFGRWSRLRPPSHRRRQSRRRDGVAGCEIPVWSPVKPADV